MEKGSDKKERILDYIKNSKKEKISASELSAVISINYYKIIEILEQLQKEGLIFSEEKGSRKYWFLKKVKK
jgi:predicted transcriptional regulator